MENIFIIPFVNNKKGVEFIFYFYLPQNHVEQVTMTKNSLFLCNFEIKSSTKWAMLNEPVDTAARIKGIGRRLRTLIFSAGDGGGVSLSLLYFWHYIYEHWQRIVSSKSD